MQAGSQASERQHNVLQIIFAFFLGIMVVAFIGVGVYTFYPAPSQAYDRQIQRINQQQNALQATAGKNGMTPAQQAEYISLQRQIDALQVKSEAQMKIWARNTSIIIVLFATAVMALSLIRAEQLRVLSNGLLLGGLFTMIYGMGVAIFVAGTSTARFAVITFALIVTIALGYVKFVRQRANPENLEAAAQGSADATVDVASLAERVAALEERAAAAAAALSPDRRD